MSEVSRMLRDSVTPVFNLLFFSLFSARKQEIIKMTEQLIEAINNGDFDAYTQVYIKKQS